MDKIIISDLLVQGIIGVNESEREKLQDILINIEIETDLHRAGITDKLEDTISYRSVIKNVISCVEGSRYYTVEALAEAIASMCLQEPGAQKARVRVEKPGAARFARSVGVEIERRMTN